MKYTSSLILLSMSALLFGCTQTSLPTNSNTSLSQEVLTGTKLQNMIDGNEQSSSTEPTSPIVDTSTWIPFVNERDGYSFKYPNDLKAEATETNIASDDTGNRVWSAYIGYADRLGSIADVFLYTNTLSDLEVAVREDASKNRTILSRNDTTIDGNAMSEILYLDNANATIRLKSYYLQMENNVIVITGSADSQDTLNAIVNSITVL